MASALAGGCQTCHPGMASVLPRGCGLGREHCRQVQTHASEGLKRAGFLILQWGLVLMAAPPQSTSKALMPWGLRVDIKAAFLPCSPCRNPLFSEDSQGPLSSQVPHSLPRCWDPWQEKNVYLKADSSKGVGVGGS